MEEEKGTNYAVCLVGTVVGGTVWLVTVWVALCGWHHYGEHMWMTLL